MELILLIISIPFFYVWGIVSFIKFLSNRGKQNASQNLGVNRIAYLEAALVELKKLPEDKKVSALIKEYETELKHLKQLQPHEEVQLPAGLAPTVENVAEKQPEAKHTHTQTPTFQNWYKDNSINLLLYIGAFLIVMSASIYVGLETVTGVSKGIVISATTALFFFSGLWFYKMPKVKNAGSAFSAIGALLIPVSGLGWYNFVFKNTDVSIGVIWLVTSLVGLFAYIILARYFKSAFYSYASSFSTLSISFAFINLQGLQNDFYLLASIMSSIVLLVISIYFRENKSDEYDLFTEPFNLTANIVLPLSIVYGMTFLSEANAFTMQATFSIFMGSVFYFISYLYFKKPWHIVAAQTLFALTLIYFSKWLELGTMNMLYLLTASVYLDLYLVWFFQKRKHIEEANLSTILSTVKTTFIFLYAMLNGLASTSLLFFAVIPIIVGAILVIITSNVYYAGLSAFFLAIALHICFQDVFGLSEKSYILGMSYSIVGAALYHLCLRFKSHLRAMKFFGVASAGYFFLGSVFIGSDWGYQLANFLTIALICFSVASIFSKKEFYYAGSIALAFAVWCFSEFLKLDDKLYITCMIYTLIAVGWYSAALYFRNRKDFFEAFISASILNFVLSFSIIFSSDFIIYQLIVSLTAAVVLFSAATEFHKKECMFLSNAFVGLTVLTFLHFLNAPNDIYPLALIALAYAFYLVSTMAHEQKETFRKSALVGSAVATVGYATISFGEYQSLERNTLIAAYATFILYSFDAYSIKSSRQGYIASAIGLATYLWQINFLGITQTEHYTLAIGFYFFVLSYLQRTAKDQSLKNLFTAIALFFLIVPSWVQSFDAEGVMHAIILGVTGIALLAFGITATDKWYRYAGIAAIVLAVISQSKWAIIGIAGLAFLGLALYLLIFRKEDPKH